jgi:flagellar protein FlaG
MVSELSLSPASAVPTAMPVSRNTAPPLRLPGTTHESAPTDNSLPHPAAAAPDVFGRAAQRVADSLGRGNSFNFSVDTKTGMTIVKVINRATGELVRQIPTEEIVHIAQLLQQEEHHPVLDVRV